VETRGIVVAGATYGDLERPARCADVTDALTHLLESQQSFGTSLSPTHAGAQLL
jgi:hypothetical protein